MPASDTLGAEPRGTENVFLLLVKPTRSLTFDSSAWSDSFALFMTMYLFFDWARHLMHSPSPPLYFTVSSVFNSPTIA